ncbi:MAG: hypothetical protein KIT73_08475 [Burkholderiales bacterium]|nr:hypothetical protein [Burkholderiales bacterium]
MSSSRIISGRLAEAARRWEPGAFDAVRTTTPESAADQPAGTAAIVDANGSADAGTEHRAVEPVPEQTADERMAEALEAARMQARAEGYAAGLEEGRQKAEIETSQLRALLENLRELQLDFEQGLATDVLSLALEVTKQMVRQSLRVKPELVFAIIREAALSFPEIRDHPRLVLHPADAALVRSAISAEMSPEQMPWEIVEDEQIERGGCRFETANAQIDATLENRWRRIVGTLGRDDSWIDLNL